MSDVVTKIVFKVQDIVILYALFLSFYVYYSNYVITALNIVITQLL